MWYEKVPQRCDLHLGLTEDHLPKEEYVHGTKQILPKLHQCTVRTSAAKDVTKKSALKTLLKNNNLSVLLVHTRERSNP